MQGFDRIRDVLDRLGSYPVWAVVVELAVIWVVVYTIVRFVQGTRAAGALKGLLFISVLATVVVSLTGGGQTLARLSYLYDRAVALVAIALIVIFQPELRRALSRLGEAPIVRPAPKKTEAAIAAIVQAAFYLSKNRFGALIVIERQSGLRGLTEGGTDLDAIVSARLLQTIFFPSSALHDLAVVVRGGRVVAAGVQLPLAEPDEMPDPDLGSRHRAAVGLTKDTDAIVVVVSEETGAIRLAERGRLSRLVTPELLERELRRRLGAKPVQPSVDSAPQGAAGSSAPARTDRDATAGAPRPATNPQPRQGPDGAGLRESDRVGAEP